MRKRIYKTGLAAAVGILLESAANAATLLPNGQQQFIDGNGAPYASGTITLYSNYPTCSILKNSWKDSAQTVLNTNPIVLDAAGRATIFGSGSYCQVLKDVSGNTIWTKETGDATTTANIVWGGTSGGSANSQTVTIPGFTATNGQTFYFFATYTNTSNLTLSVNGGAALAVVKTTPLGVMQLTGGEVAAGNVTGVVYSAVSGQLQLITNNTQQYTGEVRTFASASCPAGWLPADGSAVSTTTYPSLFAALGTTWGTNAGNVVLPDLRGIFIRGTGTNAAIKLSSGSYPSGTLGSTGYKADTYLNHAHTATDSGHTHSYTTPGGNQQGAAPGSSYTFTSNAGTTQTGSASANITVATSTTGGTETAPISAALLYCIKY